MDDNYLIKQAVEEVIDDFLKNTKGICTCSICRNKMLNIAVEHLSERYKSTKRNISYTRVQGIDIQLKADAIKELDNITKNSPGNFHEK